jgi:uncharacterized protein
MSFPEVGNGFQALRQQLADQDDLFSAVEVHGLLCAMAILPEPPQHWYAPAAGDRDKLPDEILAPMLSERDRLASRLGAGEHIQLPCRLDPYAEDEGRDLAAWCTGFMAGVMHSEACWHGEGRDIDSLLLPFILIAGLDEDPEMDELWQQEKLVRQMASGIPELLEELFLLLHDAPPAGDADQD